MKKIVGIYKITSPSGKVYIGQSWDIFKRWEAHKQKERITSPKLKASLLKYGLDSHKFEILHELPFDVDQSILDTYEILYISQYKDCGIELLNLQFGGKGGKHCQETKDKLSAANIGKRLSDDTKNKMKGRKVWNEGKTFSDETKEKLRTSHLGFKPSRESLDKKSKSLKEYWSLRTPEQKREKMKKAHAVSVITNKGRKDSDLIKERKKKSALIGWAKRKGGQT